MKNLLLIAVWALLGTGCVTLGTQYSFSGPGAIVDGKTTKADLLSRFGQPFRVGFDNGNEKWAYSYYYYSLFGGNEIEDLEVTFSPDETVSSYTYETSDPAEVNRKAPASSHDSFLGRPVP